MKERIQMFRMTPKRKRSQWYEYDIIISSEDVDLLQDYYWSTTANQVRPYFIRTINRKNVSLHKVIAQREYPYNNVNEFVVDFINGNTCDLRRSNLRLTDRRSDSFNKPANSIYYGVYKLVYSISTRYKAVNNLPKYEIIGTYDDEIEAATAWGIANGYNGPVIRPRYQTTNKQSNMR